MTMPQLMNCEHQGDGWCLDCVMDLVNERDRLVNAANAERDRLEARAKKLEQALCSAQEHLGNEIDFRLCCAQACDHLRSLIATALTDQ